MAVSTIKVLAAFALLAPSEQAAAAAAPRDAQAPILLDAQSSELDLRTNSAVFHRVRISQGNMSITADEGHATKHTSGVDFDNSVWVFVGHVKITMEQGQLTSDDAQITFANQVISKAVADGKPAEFEEPIAKTGKIAHGHADRIDYDVATNEVHFSKGAYLSNGDNEMRGESLRYNVLTQTVVAVEAEQGSQRVHIIITPPPKSPPPKSPPPKP
jgi:lipopolysaccharide export system protein LptA